MKQLEPMIHTSAKLKPNRAWPRVVPQRPSRPVPRRQPGSSEQSATCSVWECGARRGHGPGGPDWRQRDSLPRGSRLAWNRNLGFVKAPVNEAKILVRCGARLDEGASPRGNLTAGRNVTSSAVSAPGEAVAPSRVPPRTPHPRVRARSWAGGDADACRRPRVVIPLGGQYPHRPDQGRQGVQGDPREGHDAGSPPPV